MARVSAQRVALIYSTIKACLVRGMDVKKIANDTSPFLCGMIIARSNRLSVRDW